MSITRILVQSVLSTALIITAGCSGKAGPVTPATSTEPVQGAAPTGNEPVLEDEGP